MHQHEQEQQHPSQQPPQSHPGPVVWSDEDSDSGPEDRDFAPDSNASSILGSEDEDEDEDVQTMESDDSELEDLRRGATAELPGPHARPLTLAERVKQGFRGALEDACRAAQAAYTRCRGVAAGPRWETEWSGDCADGAVETATLMKATAMPFDWDPEDRLGTCKGVLPTPRIAHMGDYHDLRASPNLQEQMRNEGHLPAPENAPLSAAFIVTDQGCHRRVEQFKADGTLQVAVCVLGTLHVLFAFIKCIFETFDPILRLACLVEKQLNVKLDRGEHVTKIANGHCEFTSQTMFEVASAFAMRRVGGFLDQLDGLDAQTKWWEGPELTDEWCATMASRQQAWLKQQSFGEGAACTQNRLAWVEWEYIKCMVDVYATLVGRRNGCVDAVAAAMRDTCEFLHAQPGHPKKCAELVSIILELETMGEYYYAFCLRSAMSIVFRGDGAIIEDHRKFAHPPDGRLCGDEYIEVVNFMLKRMGLRTEQGVRDFCAMRHLSFEDMWNMMSAAESTDVAETSDTAEDQAHVGRECRQVDKAINPHKPTHLEFEKRPNSVGTMMSLRMGLDELVPSTTQVPDDAAALRPAAVHGRALMMRAASHRLYMRKQPTTHKAQPKKVVVTAQNALAKQKEKQRVHSLKQFWHCRSLGCTDRAGCNDRAHFIAARRQADAKEAAQQAAPGNIPADDQLQAMQVADLKTVSRALRLTTQGLRKGELITQIQAARLPAS